MKTQDSEDDPILHQKIQKMLTEIVYTVPDRYFDTFEGRILERIEAEKIKPFSPSILAFPTRNAQWIKIAAIGLVVVVVGAGVFRNFIQNSDPMAALTEQEILQYAQNNIGGFSASMFEPEWFENNTSYDVGDDQIIKYFEDEQLDNVSDKDIDDYLNTL